MPMKLKNYKKHIIFAPYNFLIFLDTQLHEPKISVSEFFGNGILVFSGEILGSFLLIPPPPPHAEANSSLAKIHSRVS